MDSWILGSHGISHIIYYERIIITSYILDVSFMFISCNIFFIEIFLMAQYFASETVYIYTFIYCTHSLLKIKHFQFRFSLRQLGSLLFIMTTCVKFGQLLHNLNDVADRSTR